MSNYKKTKRDSEFIPYNPSVIEPKWQKKWNESEIYKTNFSEDKKDNFFCFTSRNFLTEFCQPPQRQIW